MAPTAIVLHGTTSAGKSSLAKALQDHAEVPVFHVSMDAFVQMSRRRDMRSDAELDQALVLHQINLCSTLRRVAASHFDIILDLILQDDAKFAACLEALSSRPTFIIGVHCPLEVLEVRERDRGDRASGLARSQFGHPAYEREYSMKLDTSIITPEEGAKLIRGFVHANV
jgi:chloramphenicol 3-O phosphotransferase